MKIIIPECPRSKPATSFSRRGAFVRTWNKSTPDKERIKAWLKNFLKSEDHAELDLMGNGPLTVSIHYCMPIPVSASIEQFNLMSWGLIEHIKKPDLDNATKFISDCCNEILWPDDRQLNYLKLTKEYDLNPRIEITITKGKPRMTDKIKAIYGHLSPEDVEGLCTLSKHFHDHSRIFENRDSYDHDQMMDVLKDFAPILENLSINYGEKLASVAKKLKKIETEKKEIDE